jgi:membrane-associated phospholipid phosphatase
MPHINCALRIFLASAGALALAACAEQATSPDAGPSRLGDGIRPPVASAVTFWEAGAAVRWNGIARGLTLVHQQSPIVGQRIYAYLNLAVYDAVVSVEDAPGHPSPQAAAGAAAVTVLGFFFPSDVTMLEQALADQRSGPHWPGEAHTDFAAGEAVGRSTGQRVVGAVQTDNFGAAFTGTYPSDPIHFWTPALPLTSVVFPGLKDMRPFFLASAGQFRPPPAPAVGTPEFAAALAEVRDIAANRTPEQMTAPLTLLFFTGTSGIAGRWNQEATDLIVSHHLNERRAAHTYALMHMAAMDAYIACWEAKFTYFVIRPTQADPSISTIVGLPNHPSYPSGHSCTSGASSEVLAILFPDARDQVGDLADAIGIARMWGGVHYRFDVDAGLALGRTVAQYAASQDINGHEAYAIP